MLSGLHRVGVVGHEGWLQHRGLAGGDEDEVEAEAFFQGFETSVDYLNGVSQGLQGGDQPGMRGDQLEKLSLAQAEMDTLLESDCSLLLGLPTHRAGKEEALKWCHNLEESRRSGSSVGEQLNRAR